MSLPAACNNRNGWTEWIDDCWHLTDSENNGVLHLRLVHWRIAVSVVAVKAYPVSVGSDAFTKNVCGVCVARAMLQPFYRLHTTLRPVLVSPLLTPCQTDKWWEDPNRFQTSRKTVLHYKDVYTKDMKGPLIYLTGWENHSCWRIIVKACSKKSKNTGLTRR